jgi:CheY-like chemotaxis protein
VLLVDDERTLREIMPVDPLRPRIPRRGGDERATKRIKLLQRRNFDIVLTDLYMHEATGHRRSADAAMEQSPRDASSS